MAKGLIYFLIFFIFKNAGTNATFSLVNIHAKKVCLWHGKNEFWSTLIIKCVLGKVFEFLHCPFEGRTNIPHKILNGGFASAI